MIVLKLNDILIVSIGGFIVWSFFRRMKKPAILPDSDLVSVTPPLKTQEFEPTILKRPTSASVSKAEATRAQWNPPKTAAPYLNDLRSAELNNGLPKNLLVRVAYQESRFRPDIISGQTVSIAGAQGIMQIVPRWHPDVDPLDTTDAIYYAGNYLKGLRNQFGTWSKALAAYNWGPGNLKKAIDYYGENWITTAPKETKNYVSQITGDLGIV